MENVAGTHESHSDLSPGQSQRTSEREEPVHGEHVHATPVCPLFSDASAPANDAPAGIAAIAATASDAPSPANVSPTTWHAPTRDATVSTELCAPTCDASVSFFRGATARPPPAFSVLSRAAAGPSTAFSVFDCTSPCHAPCPAVFSHTSSRNPSPRSSAGDASSFDSSPSSTRLQLSELTSSRETSTSTAAHPCVFWFSPTLGLPSSTAVSPWPLRPSEFQSSSEQVYSAVQFVLIRARTWGVFSCSISATHHSQGYAREVRWTASRSS